MERNYSNHQTGKIWKTDSLRWSRNASSQGPFGSVRMRAEEDEEEALFWAALERLPTYDRLRKGIMVNTSRGVGNQVDLDKLGLQEKEELIERLVHVPETDNEAFLLNLKSRFERVGIDIPAVELRFEHLKVVAEAYFGSRALPTLFNFTANIVEGILNFLHVIPSRRKQLTILQHVSGVVEPKRMTLLLGPPSSGKTTLLMALAGKLDKSLKVSGKVTYNGHELHEFVPQRTAAYVSQSDIHLGELTVRETLEYSARFQGVGHRYEMLAELSRREKVAHLKPDPDLDIFMKAAAAKDQKESIMTHYILKILGLENCADTVVGNEMIRGVSGGQKKRLTTGEILVGPATVLLMDEISTGLDSSTTYQIVKNLSEFVHILDGTAVISLLQPSPETYNLFDDIILLSDGEIIYQGPRMHVLQFFELMGFQCPERKGVADFLQEVISRKDQEQYWTPIDKPWCYIPPTEFAKAFQSFHVGEELREKLARPFEKNKNHPATLVTRKYGADVKKIFKACFSRELSLLKRNLFFYIFKLIQLIVMAFITMTVFLRTNFPKDVADPDGGIYLAALYLIMTTIFFFESPVISMVIAKLPVYYKQRDLLFFPPWAYSLSTLILTIPFTFLEVGAWVFSTYYVIGFDANVGRLFRHYFVLAILTQAASGLYRSIAALSRHIVVGNTMNSFIVVIFFCLSGFVMSYDDVKKWWIWGYWCSPMMYAQTALSVNEFLGKSWSKVIPSTSEPLGLIVMKSRGIFSSADWYWIGVGALFGFTFLFNMLYTIALASLKPFGGHQVVIPVESQDGEKKNTSGNTEEQDQVSVKTKRSGVILPFEPQSLTFDDVWYSVDMPKEMKNQGVSEERLNLLKGISGSFRPRILTALMGVSGAGKTTLMDVLAGRKTGGYTEGDIRISRYPKKQETFARISGYCEQSDIHSPHVTVYESLVYSAWLRLSAEVSSHVRKMFVEEVMELIELTPLSGVIVGLPGVDGLSLEQRKRLTIAVELVANPSIIFMDEPTSGLDARAAAVVMRTVRNTVNTGRTVVCTIHQPSIDIFESFDELFLMKRGGQAIYAGPLGHESIHLINYLEGIEGVCKITEGYNPANWMFEVTTTAQEHSLGVDLVEIYKSSELYRRNKALIRDLSHQHPGSKDLQFPSEYAQPLSVQFIACLWKQHWSYWRNPWYNAVRLLGTTIIALIVGTMFWGLGGKTETQQDLFNAMGSAYAALQFIGVQNVFAVQPVLAIERIVLYRERAGGMYSIVPYAFAQVLIEIPYVFLQSMTYSMIVYAMVGFEWSAAKFFWHAFFMFFGLLFYTYFGMAAVSASPDPAVAGVLSFGFFLVWNLFSGFIIPRKLIPIWWRWCNWICPISWALYGLFASQFGDMEDVLDSGKTVKDFLDDYFGFKHDFLGVVAAVALAFVIVIASTFIFSMKFFNFQRR